jgi:hypothetical protein
MTLQINDVILTQGTSETTLFLTKMCVRNALCSILLENIDG